MNEKKNQCIHCSVESCQHLRPEQGVCSLESIQVAPTPMAYSGDPADESMCRAASVLPRPRPLPGIPTALGAKQQTGIRVLLITARPLMAITARMRPAAGCGACLPIRSSPWI